MIIDFEADTYDKVNWAADKALSVDNLAQMDEGIYKARKDLMTLRDVVMQLPSGGGGGGSGGAGTIRLEVGNGGVKSWSSDQYGVIAIPQIRGSWLLNDGDGNSPFVTQTYVDAKQRLINHVYKRTYSNVNPSSYSDVEISIDNGNLHIAIPYYVSQLVNDMNFATTGAVALKQDALTQLQLAAVNSRITSLLVSKLEGIESNAQVNTVHKVNDKTGNVVLDSDDIDDTDKAHKYVSATEKTQITTNKNDISGIKEKIPDVASSSNKLATITEVEQKINAVSAYPITYNAAGDPFPTKADLISESATYYSHGAVRTPTLNDYAIVNFDITKAIQVPAYDTFTTTLQYVGYSVMYQGAGYTVTTTNKDSLGIIPGTTVAYYSIPSTKYVYNNGWYFGGYVSQLTLTTEQIAAMNSGITAAIVANISLNSTNLNNHLLNEQNPHNVTKAQVGLGNVDNTADLDKPISNAAQTALNAKEDVANIIAEYSASSTYNLGQLVRHSGYIYVCTTAIAVAEEWDSTHWTQTTMSAAIEGKQDIIDGSLGSDTLAYVIGLNSSNQLKKGLAPNVATVYEVSHTLPFADSDTISISSTTIAHLIGNNLGKNTLKIVDSTNNKAMSFVAKWTHEDLSEHTIVELDGAYINSDNNVIHQTMTYNMFTGNGVVKEETVVATINMDIEDYL